MQPLQNKIIQVCDQPLSLFLHSRVEGDDSVLELLKGFVCVRELKQRFPEISGINIKITLGIQFMSHTISDIS